MPDYLKIFDTFRFFFNLVEFATWVGRTKGRKMYVISTLKRPVPLEHYLYTGVTGKSQDERFLIVNADGAFVPKGYYTNMIFILHNIVLMIRRLADIWQRWKLKSLKKKRLKLVPQQQQEAEDKVELNLPVDHNLEEAIKVTIFFYLFNVIASRIFVIQTFYLGWGPPQEKNLLIALMNHLEKQKQLPVVVFTFSRNRCDQNSALLTSVNLVTEKERGRTHQFFQKCISRLKGSDQKLPQVYIFTSLFQRSGKVKFCFRDC